MDLVPALREKLGVPNAPLVNSGLDATAFFFKTFVGDDPLQWWQYLRGIDFHQPVAVKYLEKGKTLVRYESIGSRSLKPFGYFSDPGVSPFHIGTSFPAWQHKVFNVAKVTPALVSKASSISFDPQDRVSRIGGGTQYVIAFQDWPKLLRVGTTKRAV
jgi:hypothetical protein